MMFVLKVMILDILLTLLTLVVILYHRSSIIPARRKWRIKMGILKTRRKRNLRKRARRRLQSNFITAYF